MFNLTKKKANALTIIYQHGTNGSDKKRVMIRDQLSIDVITALWKTSVLKTEAFIGSIQNTLGIPFSSFNDSATIDSERDEIAGANNPTKKSNVSK